MRANLHVGWPRGLGGTASGEGARRRLRRAAAALALANAVVYGLIGTGAVRVVEPAPEGDPSLLLFGVLAGGAFLLGAVLLLSFDRRPLWWLGAAFQALAIVTYFNVAPQRVPSYEVWGLSLKVAQVVLLALLLALAVTRAGSPAAEDVR
jgi:hypothetical protein